MQTDRDDEVFCIQEMNSKCCELKEPLMLTVKGMIGLKSCTKRLLSIFYLICSHSNTKTLIHTHSHSDFPFLDDNKKLEAQRTCV